MYFIISRKPGEPALNFDPMAPLCLISLENQKIAEIPSPTGGWTTQDQVEAAYIEKAATLPESCIKDGLDAFIGGQVVGSTEY